MSGDFVTSYTEWVEWHRSEVHDASATDSEVCVRGDLELLPVDPASPRSMRVSSCFYCGGPMLTEGTFDKREPRKLGHEIPRGGTEARGSISACGNCGWWFIVAEHDRVVPIVPPAGEFRTKIYEGIYKRFTVNDKEVPLSVLRRHLERKKSDVYSVATDVFERLIASIYADYFPNAAVRHIGGPGDNGIDLYAVINDEPHVVQIKRRASPGCAEGVAVVRELIGTMVLAGTAHAHLGTTADRFTKAAHKRLGMSNWSALSVAAN
jgi:hypothetical protein